MQRNNHYILRNQRIMRHITLDMRSSLLDIQLTPNNRPPPSTAVIRMHIQLGDGLRRSQNDGQLQLCVPSVRTWWLVLISRSSSDSATTGFGNSGYQSLGARLLVRMSGLAAMARSETRS